MNPSLKLILGLAIVAGLAPWAAQAQPVAPAAATPIAPAASAQPATGQPKAEEYVIGPEDVLEVEIIGQPDRGRARVYTDGTIQLNLIGKVMASGKTPRELSHDIAEALKSGGYFAMPVVNVEVVGYASRYVTVLGQVGTPGLVPISRAFHLSEILARVGGVRETGADYLILRSSDGKEKHYPVDKLGSGGPDDDPIVQAGDKIFAPTAEVFYIGGQVKNPGSYPMKTDMTIIQAIGRGGGLTDSGSDKHVKVTRGGKVIKLGPGDKILPGDVLDVGERLF